MKTAFGILRRDVGLLLRNPVALLVVVALLVLPGLYAWYCIYANWDPYANTGEMPIAVVNEDVGAKNDLAGKVNIGEQVVEQMRGNDKILWRFYDDREQALEDTRYGICYATIVFPKTLSEDVLGTFTGGASEPTIYYFPNQKYNAVAVKVADSAVTTLTRGVNQAFASRVNAAILNAVQKGVQKAEDQAGKARSDVLDELVSARSGVAETIASLDDAEDSIASWRTAMEGGRQTLAATHKQLPSIVKGLDKAAEGIWALRKATESFDASFSSVLGHSGQMISGLSARTAARVATASADARKVAAGAGAIVVQLRSYRESLVEIAEDLPAGNLQDKLLELIDELDTTLAGIEKASEFLAESAKSAGDAAEKLDGNVQDAVKASEKADKSFSKDVLPKMSEGADDLADAASGLSAAIEQLEPQVEHLDAVLDKADNSLERADEVIGQSKKLLERVNGHLGSTIVDLGAMGAALSIDKVSTLLGSDPEKVGQFVSNPVSMVTEEVYPVSNYGTAVAPFYTNLALWIGCFILISIVRLEVDRRGFERATTTERYFGRWLLLIILGLLQSQIICGVDILLGIDCANPALFMASGAIASFVYMNIIYALCITFRNIGKTLCIVVLIMQVPGSSGMYPIEIMPSFFQGIHPFLPFTYGIDAMREALCGMYGATMFADWLVLLAIVPFALLLGVAIRPMLLNLVQLFDHEMTAAGFFASEEHGQAGGEKVIRRMLRGLSAQSNYRDELERRAWAFNRRYPLLRRAGTVAAIALPYVFLLLVLPFSQLFLLSVDVKLKALFAMLVLWLAVLAALIVIEYMHRTVEEELRLIGQSIPEDAGFPDEPAETESMSLIEDVDETRKRSGAIREVFFTDVRLGLRSVIGVVVVMLLVITPSLYAWFNIAGSWNPYSGTGGLKVAVANEDKGFKGDLLPVTVNVGDTVVSQLRANTSFDWQFVSRDEALADIEAGECYASIVIPADFSENLLTYLTEGADYPVVTYYTNEKENPIAPLITQKGADSIAEGIRVTFSERVDEVLFGISADLLQYLSQPRVADYALKMAGHLDDSIADLRLGSTEIRSIADLSAVVSGVVESAGEAMKGLEDSCTSAEKALSRAEKGVKEGTSAFKKAGEIVERALSGSKGGLDALVADADDVLAALQEASGDVTPVLKKARARVDAWLDVVRELEGAVDEQIEESTDEEERVALLEGRERLQAMADALEKLSEAIGQAAKDGKGAPESIEKARDELAALLAETEEGMDDARKYYKKEVKGAVASLESSMASVSDSSRDVFDGLEKSLDGLSENTGSLTAQLGSLSTGLEGTAGKLDKIAKRIENTEKRVNKALNSKELGQMSDLVLGNDSSVLAERISVPVQTSTEALFPVANFGSSMAPFYTVLSLWVGALVMISTMKVHLTEERAEELRRRFRFKPRHEYLGRLGIFASIALMQALLVSLGDLFLLQIQCVHPVLFVLECIFIGQVFCLIVYTLAELFGDIGKAVCIILLIMQVAASGGTFPVEMLDSLLMNVAPFLPFFHGMTALQGCVAGIYNGDSFIYLGFLLVYVVLMILIGIVARKPFRFVTDWFEHQLEKTGYL